MKQNYKLLCQLLPLLKQVLLSFFVLLFAYCLALGMAGVHPEIVNAQAGTEMEWEIQSSGINDNLYSVTWNNNLFVAVGSDGIILTSPDGIVWEKQNSDTEISLYSVTFGDGKFIAVGESGIILTSPEGINWTNRSLDSYEKPLYGITFSGEMFVAVGGYFGDVLYSTNGLSWTKNENVGSSQLSDIIWADGFYMAVGNNNQVVTSPDGITWTNRSWASGSIIISSVAWSGDDFLAAGYQVSGDSSGHSRGYSLTSMDGITWVLPNETSVPPTPIYSVIYHDGKYVAVGGHYGGESEAHGIFTTTDGNNWTTQSYSESSVLKGVTWGDGIFVAVGNNGAVLTSTTGAEPTPPPSLPTPDPTLPTPDPTPDPDPKTKLGDITDNGKIDVEDVTLVMQHVLGLKALTDNQKKVADVNGDGKINVADVALIMQKVLGLIDKFPE